MLKYFHLINEVTGAMTVSINAHLRCITQDLAYDHRLPIQTPSFWSKYKFTILASSGLITGIALSVLSLVLPPLLIAGIGFIIISLSWLIVAIKQTIAIKQREIIQMKILQELKYSHIISPATYLSLKRNLHEQKSLEHHILNINKVPQNSDLIELRAQFYDKFEKILVDLAASLTQDVSQGELEKAYDIFALFLQDHLPDDFDVLQERLKQVGRFNRLWAKVNDAYERVLNKGPLHLTCGCHLASPGKTLPYMNNRVIEGLKPLVNPVNTPYLQDKDPLVLFTTNAGQGNVTGTLGIMSVLQDRYHIYVAPTHSDFENKAYNWLLQGQRWTLMSFLMWAFAENERSIVSKFAEQVETQMTLYNPRLVISVSPHINRACHEIASLKQHIPLFAISTDCGAKDHMLFMPPHPPLFTLGLPYDVPAAHNTLLGKVSKEQISIIGYPIPEVFRKKYNPLEIRYNMNTSLDVSREIGGDLSIRDDTADIITIMMGSNGNDLLELYADLVHKTSFKGHVFICCARNKELFLRLKKKYRNASSFHPLPQITQEAVAKLFATSKLLITRASGATIAQAAAMKLPLLVDDTTQENTVLYWQTPNPLFVEEAGLGRVIRQQNNFTRLLQESLESPYAPDFAITDFRGAITQTIEKITA